MEIRIKQHITNYVHEKRSVLHFEEGEVVKVADNLAQALIDEGKAEAVAKPSSRTHSNAQGKGK